MNPSLLSALAGRCQSEGFPNGIFHPCVLWDMGSGQMGEMSARRRRRCRRRRHHLEIQVDILAVEPM